MFLSIKKHVRKTSTLNYTQVRFQQIPMWKSVLVHLMFPHNVQYQEFQYAYLTRSYEGGWFHFFFINFWFHLSSWHSFNINMYFLFKSFLNCLHTRMHIHVHTLSTHMYKQATSHFTLHLFFFSPSLRSPIVPILLSQQQLLLSAH